MWLRELKIRNFRKIVALTVSFPRGLTVLVGENNSGKTTIIDALRLMLFSSRDPNSLRLTEDDFRTGTERAPVEISCRFAGLEDEDEVHFQECLVDIGGGKFEMQVNARVEFNETTNRCNVKMWGGETEGGSLPSNHYDRLATIYLQPLRDPDRGLRPGQQSQVSRLVDSLTKENQRSDFEAIAKDANEKIRVLKPVKDAKDDINTQMAAIAGGELAQKTELIFSDPAFRRIIAGLQPEIEGLPFALNGLGYNNLIFTSATLGTLRRSPQFSFRSILVEEPEAHLHPQLQRLLLRHFADVASPHEGNEVQVIVSSHSPILASQAPIDSVVSVHEADGKVSTVSVCSMTIDDKIKKKLQRYLDATRGELFFARRIIMVEGIAETLLLPVLAEIAGGNLKESAVTLLNADGINFNAFTPLLGADRLRVPVVILTDGDAKEIGGEVSATASGLREQAAGIPNLNVEMSEITFEHELARSGKLLPHMVSALKELHPIIGATLETNLAALATVDEKATEFLDVFIEKSVSKGRFAQELAGILADGNLGADDVPDYIRNALKHLGVLSDGETMSTTDQLREAILAQDPTDEQREAIFAEELEFLLRAAPGSGKTWTSCRRFTWRAANWPYSVGGLALLSFTNAAIREFKTATTNVGRRDLLSDPNYVGTFDSFVERYILVPFGHLLTGTDKRPKLFPGPRPGDWRNTQLKVWLDGKGGRKIPVPAWEIIPYPDGAKLRFKASRNFGGQPISSATAPVYKLLSLGYYTHPQRIFWACKLLIERPHLAELLAMRFPEIIVDEAQDTNAWLLILLNVLRHKGAKITLIGDPDQCIFEFSMADATSLPILKTKWSIPERPLSQSFRCNNQIAAAARNVGGNAHFTGVGDGANEWHRAFVVEESSNTFADSLAAFQRLASQAELDLNSASVVCRGHRQLESLRGKANYANLTGKAKDLASAAFLRDSRHDYRGASQTVERIVRELTGDDPLWERIDTDPDSHERMAVALAIWKFVKSPDRLTTVSQLGDTWIPSMRTQLASLIEEIGLQCEAKLGHHIKATGLSAAQKALPLLESVHEVPALRQDTIHQVKGDSIDAVLVIGSTQFWNSVIGAVQSDDNTEDRRLAYVAMTRARHLLVVGLPKGHYDKHSQIWVEWGFRVAS